MSIVYGCLWHLCGCIYTVVWFQGYSLPRQVAQALGCSQSSRDNGSPGFLSNCVPTPKPPPCCLEHGTTLIWRSKMRRYWCILDHIGSYCYVDLASWSSYILIIILCPKSPFPFLGYVDLCGPYKIERSLWTPPFVDQKMILIVQPFQQETNNTLGVLASPPRYFFLFFGFLGCPVPFYSYS